MARGSRVIAVILGTMVLAFLVAVVVANVRNAMHRRAYTDTERILMRNGTLLEVYRWKTGSYPSPSYSGLAAQLPSRSTLGAVASSLGVEYPWETDDGWENALVYIAEPDGLHYALVSAGSNATVDEPLDSLLRDFRVIDSWYEDVVFKDGNFFRWRQAWCCNPDFQGEDVSTLEERIRRGAPARLE